MVLNIFLKKLKQFIGNRKVKANTFGVQANNSIMCGYFCIGFIDLWNLFIYLFMLANKKLTDFTNFFLLMILIKMIK